MIFLFFNNNSQPFITYTSTVRSRLLLSQVKTPSLESFEYILKKLGCYNSVLFISESYSVREARIHVRRLRDLMSTSHESNAHNASENLSHSFSVAVSGVEIEGKLYFWQ